MRLNRLLNAIPIFAFIFGFLFLAPQALEAATISVKDDPCPKYYVLDENTDVCRRYEVISDWATGFTSDYSSALLSDNSGNIYQYYYNYSLGEAHIKKVNSDGGAATTVNLTDGTYTGIYNSFFAKNGHIFTGRENGSNWDVYRIDLNGTEDLIGQFSNTAISFVADSNNDVYAIDGTNLLKMDFDTGNVTTFLALPNNMFYPGLSIDGDDNIYVTYSYVSGYDSSVALNIYTKVIKKITPAAVMTQVGPSVVDLTFLTKTVVGEDNNLYTTYEGFTLPVSYFNKTENDGEVTKYDYTNLAKSRGGASGPYYLGKADINSNTYGLVEYFGEGAEYGGAFVRTTRSGYVRELITNAGINGNGLAIDVSGDVYFLDGATVDKIDFTGDTIPSPLAFEWQMNGGKTSAAMSMAEFNGKLYQAIRGNSDPYHIYIRATSDGEFDGSSAEENWNKDGVAGKTSEQPSLAVFNNRLYIAVRGNSGNVFTKSMGTDGNWDSTWNDNGGATGTSIGMTTVNFGDGDRLYQVIRGNSTNNVYVRYTKDGSFNGGEGEVWSQVSGQTPNAIAITSLEGVMYMSVRGNSGEIFNRFTDDGVWDGDNSNENFIQNGGKTSLAPTLAAHDGAIYQVVKGNSTEYIFTRASKDGLKWTGWVERGGKTQTRPAMGSALGKLFQSVRGNSGEIFSRETPELQTFFSTNENWDFYYFSSLGEVDASYSASACPDGSGVETVISPYFGADVNAECDPGSIGSYTTVRSTNVYSYDGHAFTLIVGKYTDVPKAYFVYATTSDLNGIRIMTTETKSVTEVNKLEQEITSLIKTLSYRETSTVGLDNDAFLGNEGTAQVAVVVFHDFEGPYDKAHHVNVFPQIVDNYVDTGEILYVVRDYPLGFHNPAAHDEAHAAECARAQGNDATYFDYIDDVFAATAGSGGGLTSGGLTQIATNLGLNGTTFDNCMNANTFDAEIANDMSDAEAAEVSGVPTFFIGIIDGNNVEGVMIPGNYPYSVFEEEIERQLARASI